MRSLSSILLLPPTLLALLPLAVADTHPTALRKLSPDSNDKLFPEHLAFAPLFNVPAEGSLPQEFRPLDDDQDETEGANGSTPRLFRRAFAAHYDETQESMLRRAAEVLAILEKRSSCPSGMNSCGDMGSPNKCCQKGTYCTDVPDTMVGHVACCPDGSDCGGAVGDCPTNAVSCPPDLGGGCCISGFICEGIGCVTATSASAAPTETEVHTTTEEESSQIITTTRTTTIEGEPSTVVVTMTVTEFPSMEPTTLTNTEVVTATETGSEDTETETATATATATGGAPWRPTITSGATTGTDDSDTQTGCPTGFYGCLATHGGGCCRTDRDCATYSCPAPSSTTIVSDGNTIVVPATDLPTYATSTCADGWFLCDKDSGGPTAGCCPSGYDCGTASCFTVEASQTEQVQKQFPDKDAASMARASGLLYVASLMAALALGW